MSLLAFPGIKKLLRSLFSYLEEFNPLNIASLFQVSPESELSLENFEGIKFLKSEESEFMPSHNNITHFELKSL